MWDHFFLHGVSRGLSFLQMVENNEELQACFRERQREPLAIEPVKD